MPGYQVLDSPTRHESGWADDTFLLKYRLAAANEESGNYIVTAFLGLSVPTGSEEFTTGHTIVTPTIAAGKGWGTREWGFDIQSTLGVSFLDGDAKRANVAVPITWNTAVQAHVLEKFWPELELNYTHYRDGANAGKTQVAVTSGLVLGRFPLAPRVNAIVGAGYQQAVSSFRTFEHAWLATARVTF